MTTPKGVSSPDDGAAGFGVPVYDDDEWALARRELYAAPSLVRIGVTARFTVGAVSLVGTALSALGLASASRLPDGPAATVAYAAAAFAFVAVICALSYLGLRLSRVNSQNLVDVKHWYDVQFRRAWLVALSSWLLVLAVILAGVAALVAILAPVAPEPVLALTRTTGAEPTLSAAVSVSGLAEGDRVEMTVVGPANAAVMRGTASPDGDGIATLESTATTETDGAYRLVVEVNGEVKATLESG